MLSNDEVRFLWRVYDEARGVEEALLNSVRKFPGDGETHGKLDLRKKAVVSLVADEAERRFTELLNLGTFPTGMLTAEAVATAEWPDRQSERVLTGPEAALELAWTARGSRDLLLERRPSLYEDIKAAEKEAAAC